MSSKFSNLLSQARNRPTEEDDLEAEQGSEGTPVGGTATEDNAAQQPSRPLPPTSTTTSKTSKPKSIPHKNNPKPPKTKNPDSSDDGEPHSNGQKFVDEESPSRGRPRTGKRSDPNYTQITAYITKKTHRDVKIALVTEDQGREISEVVEELLAKWLDQQP